MLIEFLWDVIYETEGPGRGPKFAKGEVVEFPDHIGERWTKRGHRHVDYKPPFTKVSKAQAASAAATPVAPEPVETAAPAAAAAKAAARA
jgi:hypothetical protein